ncbi:aldo/keto reductase [Belliella kenyensis]|uniref:Aldo/keto reductase n=1 Tax=Belliella kenyensis TaxID=1472724 RepID=A0ABV8EJS3_9BACT|nr:aldo/keto reductase [Belliella kenyensis]MCH7400256.1 aldo/keto reductase [Belliella kenyensis]MDN3604727.1 aldo/keto reductase [Belliella kenyensis]
MKSLSFQNGDQIPIIGLGTWKSKPGEVYQAVLSALKAGYRHIDCAAIYDNEIEVGKALKDALAGGIVSRKDLFVTSKLWNDSHRKEDVKIGIQKTLKDLQLDYLDLYLIHWPVSFKKGVGFAESREQFYTYADVPLAQTWQGMQQMQQEGLTRHIGVSNFNTEKLKELFAIGGQGPELNQVEMHPYLRQEKLVNFCKDKGMLMTAYSPLGSGDRSISSKKSDEPKLFEDHLVLSLADKYKVSPAQILIAFSVHRDIAVIPKSVNEERIKQNLEAGSIEFEVEDFKALNAITTQYRFIDGTFFTGSKSPYNLSDLWEEF